MSDQGFGGRVFEGKTVFVTGGSGAIGGGCAEAIVRDGAAAMLMGRGEEALESTRAGILERNPGARVEIFPGDAMDEQSVIAGLAAAYAIQGSLDVVIPTVGGGAIRPLLMHNAETFQETLDLNIMSAFIAVRHAAPLMVKSGGGTIVCISSDAAKLVFPWLPAYTTGKSALEGFVRAAAEELSSFKIRVNAVRPGMTRSAGTASLFADPEIYRRFSEEKPLGRLGEPEDVAAGVRYLAGPESSWVTGQSLGIEGGNEMRKAPDLGPMVEQIYGGEAWKAIREGKAPFDDSDFSGV
jgi:NAD(P)-dependent dehydrogenase (short-subunit alcohol dehydrogenase family)